MAPPGYPSPARFSNIQGQVEVDLAIGTDGRVMFADGSGSGVNAILVRAAEENARQWKFGPFPANAEFPIYHKITYVYKLEGKPLVVGVVPRIKTYLPDRVEITAVPMVSDYPPSSSYEKRAP